MQYRFLGVFAVLVLLNISGVMADVSYNDTINSTYINTTVFTDIRIEYSSLIDNESGIYFTDLEWINQSSYRYVCADAPITTENQSYLVSTDFPLAGWSCIATFIPSFSESTIFTPVVFGILLSIAVILAIVGFLIEGFKNLDDDIIVIGSVTFYVVSSILLLVVGFALVTNGLSIETGTQISIADNITTETAIYSKAPVFANYTGFLFILFAIGLFSRCYYIYKNKIKYDSYYDEGRKIYKYP